MGKAARMSTAITHGTERRRARRSRMLAAVSVSVGFALVSLTGATSAQAANWPAFEIFYGPNCGGGQTSSHVYSGVNFGEGWVSDTFNTSGYGTTGRGQLVRNNAASIYLSHATVRIYTDGNSSAIAWEQSSGAGCFNFPDGVRNHNTQWSSFPYNG
jgi:hypothetical protein